MNGEASESRKLPRATKAEDEPNLRGLKPSEPFFMVVSVANLDGSIEIPGEGIESVCTDEAQAIEDAKGINTEYADLDCYVYRCVPIARIWRGQVKIQRLSEPKRSPR